MAPENTWRVGGRGTAPGRYPQTTLGNSRSLSGTIEGQGTLVTDLPWIQLSTLKHPVCTDSEGSGADG